MKDATKTMKGLILKSSGSEAALPELERMLANTAGRQVKESKGGLGRRIAATRASRIAAIGVACLAFGGSAMAAGVWNPEIGTDSPIEGEGSALSGEGPPAVVTSPVPAAVTDALGVLRRDPTAQDRSAEVEATLAGVSFVDRVRPDSVRFLAPGDRGEATIVLSAERSLDTEASKSSLAFSKEEEPICVFRPGAAGYGHQSDVVPACFGLTQLLAGRAYTEEINSPPGRGLAFGLVPDGVASVTAEFADAPEVTVPVSDNYFEVPMSGAQVGEGKGDFKGGVQRVVWRDADGALVPQRSADADQSGASASTSERSGTPASATERITSSQGQSPSSP
jgi:hypothetical protein